MVAGLVQAYQMAGTAAYKTAAEDGGDYIINTYSPGFYAEDVYALTRLSDISSDPKWGNEASGYYSLIETYSGPGGDGTDAYIADWFIGMGDPSGIVLSLAHHTVASHKVNATEKSEWRDGVITALGDVDDTTANYPVMALGVGVWALGLTGGFDPGTTVPGAGDLSGMGLDELPDELLSHQESSGEHAGSFYWQFGHLPPLGGGEALGYTEDTVFGTLGLIAAHSVDFADYSVPISLGRQVVGTGVGSDGRVYDHLWSGTTDKHYFAGEALRLMIPEPTTLSLLGVASLALWARRRRRAQASR